MAKINDTSLFPIQTDPADDDLVLGTDVSNTSNDPGGETVNIRVDAISGGPKLLQTITASGDTSIVLDATDGTKYSTYLVGIEDLTATSLAPLVYLSDDGGSTKKTTGYLGVTEFVRGDQTAGGHSLGSTTNSFVSLGVIGTTPVSGHFFVHSLHGTSSKPVAIFEGFQAGSSASGSYSMGQRASVSANGEYDSLVVEVGSGTFSGTLRLYGIRN